MSEAISLEETTRPPFSALFMRPMLDPLIALRVVAKLYELNVQGEPYSAVRDCFKGTEWDTPMGTLCDQLKRKHIEDTGRNGVRLFLVLPPHTDQGTNLKIDITFPPREYEEVTTPPRRTTTRDEPGPSSGDTDGSHTTPGDESPAEGTDDWVAVPRAPNTV